MKKFIFSFLLLSLHISTGRALSPSELHDDGGGKSKPEKDCKGHVILSSQAQVDAFNCKDVNGLLTISGADITNLDALASLKHVRGLHITGNPLLTNLDGLSRLETIRTNGNTDYAALMISGNALLENIDGLSSLREINGKGYMLAIAVSENPRLKDIDGFYALTKIGPGAEGGIRIHNNVSLENVDGLSSIVKIHPAVKFSLEVTDNESLARCCGLFAMLRSLDPKYYPNIRISGNGAECTLDKILEAGACFDFQADKTFGCVNDTISFKATASADDSVHWDFGEGATPATAEGIGPHAVTYTTGGKKTVVLMVNQLTLVKKDYVQIKDGPGDRNVVAEYEAGCAGHATNIIVLDYEEGILYTLRNDADNSVVAGPYTGDIGLYTGALSESTTFNILATDPKTGCQSVLSIKPVVTINTPQDKNVVAEAPSGAPGHATNIIVMDPQPGIYYTLRNDANDSTVAGPYTGDIGLYSGALEETTTFNVLAYDSISGCQRELGTKVTVTITNDAIAGRTWTDAVHVYPNPAKDAIDVSVLKKYSGPLWLRVRNIAGEIVYEKNVVVDADSTFRQTIDLGNLAGGFYMFSIQHDGEKEIVTKRVLIVD